MKRTTTGLVGLLLYAAILKSVLADSYVGQFVGQLDGEEYRLSIERSAGSRYEGEFHAAGLRLALGALRFGEKVMGQIRGPEGHIGITLSVHGNGLRFENDDGEVIFFQRVVESGSSGM